MLFNLLFPLCILAQPLLSFGAKNDAELSRLDWLFASKLRCLFFLVRILHGWDVLIVDGLRTAAEQLALHHADPRNPATVGTHDGHAVDVNFLKSGRLVLGKKGFTAAQWAPIYTLCEWCGILNGSTFTGYADLNHLYVKK